MKLLWFSNTPSLYKISEKNEGIGGGWIETLEREFRTKPEYELGIAFLTNDYINIELQTKREKNITYFLIPNRSSSENLNNYKKIIIDFSPELIHIFGTENDFGLIGSHTNIPVVVYLQGIITVYLHKMLVGLISKRLINSHFKSENSTILKMIEKKIFELLYLVKIFKSLKYMIHKSRIEKEIFTKVKYFIGQTDWDRRIVNVLSNNSRYFFTNTPIRECFFKNEWISKSYSEFTIISVFTGRIYKGLETIYEAAFLLKKNKNFNFKWKIVGINEDDGIKKFLEARYCSSFREYNICFLGALNSEQIISQFLTSNLFIHPSHIDNWPNVVSEAMLLGVPIISTNTGGTPSLISDANAVLVQDGDPYALSGAILELFDSPKKCMELSKNARITARARLETSKVVSELEHIYAEILKVEENNSNAKTE